MGIDVYGFREGWGGVLEGSAHEITLADVRGILPRGETIVGTSGVEPPREVDGAGSFARPSRSTGSTASS